MFPAHLVSRFGFALVALAGLAATAQGGFMVIPQPNAAYQASTTKFAVPNSGPPLTSLVSGDRVSGQLTITFSGPMTPLQSGPGHFTWGHVPFVEDTAPAVLFSQGATTRVLTFSQPLETFGLEMVPNETIFFPATLTVDFFNGGTLVGEIRQGVRQSNARLFAATDADDPFTSVRLTSSGGFLGFLIGDIRAETVPEPASLTLFGLGLLGVIGYGWRRRARPPRRDTGTETNGRFRPQIDALEDRCLLSAGALDTTFGGTGVVTTSLGKSGASADAVLIQPWDGKIVVAGDSSGSRGAVMSLARYNADGSLDGAFGSGGKAVSGIGTNGYNAAALYPSTDTTGNAKRIVEAGAGSLARFNANGSTDTSFGRRGLVAVPWGIAGVVIQPADGKIVVGGDNGSAFELARYNPNGTLDTSFGSGGTATLPVGSVYSESLVLQADGKLVIGGETDETAGVKPYNPELARFNANGTLDTTFNSAGAVPGTVTFAFADQTIRLLLVIYPSTSTDTADYGKIAVAATIFGNPGGINSNQVALARYNADGSADSTFGQSGQVVTPFPSGGSMVWAAALQADGKIVVAGKTYHYPGNGHWAFSLLRYNTDASLDTTFGARGLVTTPNATGDRWAKGVAIQADGRIVAAGTTNSQFMVARYLAGPEIGTFTASASTVTAGSGLTLTASNITDGDPGATITQVAFYAIDGNGHQYLLGTGTLTSGVWTLNYTVSLAPGSYALFAQAMDSDGTVGDSAFLPLTVQ
jgi:uncharacterized delta-60 repeat protein